MMELPCLFVHGGEAYVKLLLGFLYVSQQQLLECIEGASAMAGSVGLLVVFNKVFIGEIVLFIVSCDVIEGRVEVETDSSPIIVGSRG